MTNKDQIAIAKLYMENHVDYDGESAWIPSGVQKRDNSPLNVEQIRDMYSKLEDIEELLDRLSEIMGEKTNSFWQHINSAKKIIYPYMEMPEPREEY